MRSFGSFMSQFTEFVLIFLFRNPFISYKYTIMRFAERMTTSKSESTPYSVCFLVKNVLFNWKTDEVVYLNTITSIIV